MKEDNKKGNVKSYIYYIIILVVVLIISTVSVAYAYVSLLNPDENQKKATTSVSGKTDCIDIQLDANGSATGLTYNYPITDAYAVGDSGTSGHVEPVTITLTNKCTEATKSVNYSVVLTSLAKSTGETYIPDSKIKVMVQKNSASLLETQALSALTKIGNKKTTYNLLMEKLNDTSSSVKDYDVKAPYLIESSSLASGASVSYSAYLWIDYNEGSTNANNSTEGQNFASILSVVVNNPETFTE